MSKCGRMFRMFNNMPDVRRTALEFDDSDMPKKHTGKASKIFKLRLPISKDVALLLFASISVDATLPKKRKRGQGAFAPVVREELADSTNPARNVQTVSSQTYQNYKSALKWWHEFNCLSMDKIGVPFPADVDAAVNKAIASYKRDVGSKKRRGIMAQKEGKSPFSLFGYCELSKYFKSIKPCRNRKTWMEGMFADLFAKLSVNTIGRSDNIDDLLLSNMDWANDALCIRFGTTKPDQSGESTSEIKRLFANPFKPELCVILSLAVYTWCKRRGTIIYVLFIYITIIISYVLVI